MCTVTYLPLYGKGFILTSSRDEKAIRPPAQCPQLRILSGQDVYFPQDPQGKGTWMATSRQTTLCLLNGAFIPHTPQPPYKHSRGLVILHFFEFESLDAFLDQYDFQGIEPFTLIIVEENRLVELRWTGKKLITHEKDSHKPAIWSSVTLYSSEVIAKRTHWFRDWLRGRVTSSVEDIRRFHQTAGDGDGENDLRMNRGNQLYTVSLTSIRKDPQQVEIFYEDLLTQDFTHQILNCQYEPVYLPGQ